MTTPTTERELAAGRELDALIAEKVMGWRRLPYWCGSEELTDLFPPIGGDFDSHGQFPEYSTDIAAAWEVVEKMAKIHHCLSVECQNPGDDQWRIFAIGFNKPGFILHATAAEAAECICLAALKAVSA